jgi:predicted dehydrogenase
MMRVAIIGCGAISRAHARGWAGVSERARVVAMADIDAQNRAGLRDQLERGYAQRGLADHNITEFDSYEEMLQAVKPDAVDICLPHDLHAACLVTTIQHGIHWLCEKPLCRTREEIETIRKAAGQSEVIGMMAHNQVFLPTICEARRLVERNAVGRIYRITSRDQFVMGVAPAGSLPGTRGWNAVADGAWRADRERMGGGVLIDTGYHPTYRLLFLARETPSDVVALTMRHRLHDMQGEDTASVLCRFDSGFVGEIHASWATDLPTGAHLFHIMGEHGEIYGDTERLHLRPHGMRAARRKFPAVDTFAAEVEHFVTCVESGKRPIQTLDDGMAVAEVILGAYDFARTRGMTL